MCSPAVALIHRHIHVSLSSRKLFFIEFNFEQPIALDKLYEFGMENDKEILPGGRFAKDPFLYALDKFTFYECSRCKVT